MVVMALNLVALIVLMNRSIGRINTLFSLFHQEKKEIHDAVQPWGIRNLTDFRRHSKYCSFPPVNPSKFQPHSLAEYLTRPLQIDPSAKVSFGHIAVVELQNL